MGHVYNEKVVPGEVLTMSYCKSKLDEEKLKYEENGFDSALLQRIWWLVKEKT